jgi:hypothetical protein
MTNPILKNEVQLYQWLRAKLLDCFPETDDETIRDTLEGLTDLHEMIAAIIRSALIDEALHAGLRSRLEDMKQRLLRLEERGSTKRQLALEAMAEVGLRRLEQPDFTASARAGSPHLILIAEAAIPPSYWVPQPPKLDRQSLLTDLKRGDGIPGAQLSNPKPILSVRTK